MKPTVFAQLPEVVVLQPFCQQFLDTYLLSQKGVEYVEYSIKRDYYMQTYMLLNTAALTALISINKH